MSNETPKPDAKDAEIADLKAKLALEAKTVKLLKDDLAFAAEELKEAKDAKASGGDLSAILQRVADGLDAQREANAKLMGVPDKDKMAARRASVADYPGERSYIVGPQGAWRNNRRYKQGDVITVTNERPAKDWTPVEKGEVEARIKAKNAANASKPAQSGRAADRNVG